ncbi:MAG TPA: hypothetical protein VGH83_00760 [Candidatus Acidoferrum sp.]|jgi:hypothetical protein
MARHNKRSTALESITYAALVGLAVVALTGSLASAQSHLGNLLWHLLGARRFMIPSLVLSGLRAIQAHAAGSCWLIDCFPRLLSCLSALLPMTGAL